MEMNICSPCLPDESKKEKDRRMQMKIIITIKDRECVLNRIARHELISTMKRKQKEYIA
jgi:hypothetical protein